MDYNQFLKDLHSKSLVTTDFISELIFEVTKFRPIAQKRITAGEVNEVYDIELPGRNSVIARFHKSEKPVFLQEKWAIEQCLKIRVPAPTVLAIKHITQVDGILSCCVQQKLPGDSLERGELEYDKVDPAQRKIILHKAGALLTKMHAIPVIGWGSLDENGRGDKSTFIEAMVRSPEKEREYIDLALKLGIEKATMERAFKILRVRAPIYADTKPTFNHGDFAPKHFMYIGTEITGILDFGDVLSHSPIYDFARWEFWYENNENFTWLKEGYGNQAIFKDSDELSRLIQLYMCLGIVKWYTNVVYDEGIRFGVTKLNNLVGSFK